MFTNSRKVVALGLVTTLAVAGIALADGASENAAAVDGKVTPSKLSKKKFKPVSLRSGIRNSLYTSGKDDSENPTSEFLSYSNNIKLSLRGVPRCPEIANNTPTNVARMECPARSYLGGGTAQVRNPNDPSNPDPPGTFDQVVSIFHGPNQNELQLHTYGELGGLSPVVPAKIVNAPGKKWGKALSVPVTPETGTLLFFNFSANLMKGTRVVKARCNPKRFSFKRKVTYKDGSSETVTKSQKCKVRR